MRRLRAFSTRPRWANGLFVLLPVCISIACSLAGPGAPTATPAITPAASRATPSVPPAQSPTQPTTEPATLPASPAASVTPLSPATQSPSVTPVSPATQPPSSTQPGDVTIDENIAFGSGAFVYTDTQAGLAQLSSYTAAIRVAFTGTNAGQAEQWSETYALTATNNPPVMEWTVVTTGSLSSPGTQFLAETAGTDYDRPAGQDCTATEIEAGNSLADRLAPRMFLPGVIGAQEAGSQTINKIATQHYTFDQRALGQDGLTQSTGELWVAAQGGYVVKYLLSSQGGADYFGDGVEGTLTLSYSLTGVNQVTNIQLPSDCPPGMLDLPLPPGAANVVQAPGLLAYDSASNLADETAYVQKQLTSLGWTTQGKPAASGTGTVLTYTQADQQLTVMLHSQDGRTTVNVVEANKQT